MQFVMDRGPLDGDQCAHWSSLLCSLYRQSFLLPTFPSFSLPFFSISCYSLFRVIYLCLTQSLTKTALYGNLRKKHKTGEPGRLAEASVVGNTSASLDPCPALRLRALPNGVFVSDNACSIAINILELLRQASLPEWTSTRSVSPSMKDRYGWTMACWGRGCSSVTRAYA